MEGLFSLLLFAGLFFFMMRFGCGAHMHEQLRTMQEDMKQMRDMGGMKTQTGMMGIAHDGKQGGMMKMHDMMEMCMEMMEMMMEQMIQRDEMRGTMLAK